jgi:hypothetical protein
MREIQNPISEYSQNPPRKQRFSLCAAADYQFPQKPFLHRSFLSPDSWQPFLPDSAYGVWGFLRRSTAFLLFAIPRIVAAAGTNSVDPASSLNPPRGEILPTFWEQYGGWVIVLSALLIAVIAFVVWLTTRPKAILQVPWPVQARAELQPLRKQPEDGILLSRISRILRYHIALGFGLPLSETTTAEFCRAIADSEKVGPEISSEITEFLKECDLRKFGSSPPPLATFDGVVRCLKIIDKAEKRLADLQPAVSPATPGSGAAPMVNARPDQGLAKGA